MSQAAASPDQMTLSERDYQQRHERLAQLPVMQQDNIYLPDGATNGISTAMLGVAVLCLGLTIFGGIVFGLEHALASYWVGVMTVLALSLGCMFFTMVFHSLNAGWTGTIRRQFENVAANLKIAWVLMIPIVLIELLSGGVLLTWLGIDPADNYLIKGKQPFLTNWFLIARFLFYGAVWVFLSQRLYHLSREQDKTGDRTAARRARFMSGWGLLVFALTTAFAAFDWLMSLDFRFFSTMWGVYYFASTALGAISIVVIILAVLRTRGRLTGVVTEEHFHDLGKLMFGFTVFWGYIAFGQYFLIWYSNIPEETAWFVYRQSGGWQAMFVILALGHFVLPFLVLLFRKVKRSTIGLGAVAGYLLLMIVLDMIWIIRPMVYAGLPAEQIPGMETWWLDLAGILGVVALFGFFLVRRIGAGPLIPLKDPMLHEALKHKNYV